MFSADSRDGLVALAISPETAPPFHLHAALLKRKPMSLQAHKRIYVAGHRGLVGSALVRALTRRDADNIVTRILAHDIGIGRRPAAVNPEMTHRRIHAAV
jgi:hypothetical protein